MSKTLVHLYDQDGNLFSNSERDGRQSRGGLPSVKKIATEENAVAFAYRVNRAEARTRHFITAGPMGQWYEVSRSTFYNELDEMISNSVRARQINGRIVS